MRPDGRPQRDHGGEDLDEAPRATTEHPDTASEADEPAQATARRSRQEAGPLRLLQVEDDDDDAELVMLQLVRDGYRLDSHRVDNERDLVRAVGDRTWDIIVSDHSMHGFTSMDVLRIVRPALPHVPVVLVSGQIGEEAAVAAMHAGAADYVPKQRLKMLAPAIDRALKAAAEARERRRAEAEVHKREAQLAQAQALAHLGSFEWGPHAPTVWSEELYRILGHDPAQVPASVSALVEQVVEEDRAVVGAALEAAAHADGPAADVAFRFVRADGQERWAALKAERLHQRREAPPDDATAGHGVRVVGAVQDITDRKRAEEAIERSTRQMAQSEKLAALGTMMASVGHEINNPLSFLATNEQLLVVHLDRLAAAGAPGTADAVAAMRRIVDKNVECMARIREIAEALKLAVKPVGTEREVHDLRTLVAASLPLVATTAKEKQVRVERDLDGPGSWVRVNVTAVTQIVMNLVANAVESSPTGTAVRVSVRAAGDAAEVVVEDEGPGVPDRFTERIFEPFFTTKSAGTGLGLAISRELAESQGGALHCEAATVGARFIFRLPVLGDEVTAGAGDGSAVSDTDAAGASVAD